MGSNAGQHAYKLRHELGDDTTAHYILIIAAHACMDQTGFVAWSHNRLCEETGYKDRQLRKKLTILNKLGLLVYGDKGFRLARYCLDRNICGPSAKNRTNDRTKCVAQEEGFHVENTTGRETKRERPAQKPLSQSPPPAFVTDLEAPIPNELVVELRRETGKPVEDYDVRRDLAKFRRTGRRLELWRDWLINIRHLPQSETARSTHVQHSKVSRSDREKETIHRIMAIPTGSDKDS